MPQKTLIPDPDGRQIAYSRVAAVMLAIRLLNDAADALLTGQPKEGTTPMTAQKPVYSRPSDDKVVAERRPLHEDDGVTKRDPTTEAKGIAKRHPLQDDGDAVAEHHPTSTEGQNRQNTSFDHHKRNRRTHAREKRRARELRAENEMLHRRLAAIYDALTLD